MVWVGQWPGSQISCVYGFQSAPQPWQHGQLLITKFPCSSPHLPAPLSEGRAMWLVLANMLQSEAMVCLFWAKAFKSWCATFHLLLPLWQARGNVLRWWSHKTEQTRLLSHYMEGWSRELSEPTAYFELLINFAVSSFWDLESFGWCSIARGNPTPSDTWEVSVRQVITWPQGPKGGLGLGRTPINSGRYKALFTIEKSSPQLCTRDKTLFANEIKVNSQVPKLIFCKIQYHFLTLSLML